jgi:hypothetical protein
VGGAREDRNWEDLVLDAGTGFIAVAVSSVASLAIGRFFFPVPWMGRYANPLFWAGYFRGKISGSPWVKAAAVDASVGYCW